MNNKLCITVTTLVALGLSLDAYAGTCNRKAQSHQEKARNIYLMVKEFKQIPSQEDEEFVLCMIEEKEDKEDFQGRIRKLKDEKRSSEAREAQERAKAAEQQQREQQIANQRAQEQAAREAQAERRIVSIQGTTDGYDGYYLGRVTSEDVIIVEPLGGRYSRVGIIVGGAGYTDEPRPSFSPGARIPSGRMGGTGVQFNTPGSIRINVSQATRSLPPGRLVNAQLKFLSADNMQIRVTILCVHVANSIPCKDRDQSSSVTSTVGNAPSSARPPDGTRRQDSSSGSSINYLESLRVSCASDTRYACVWIAETISSTCKKLDQCANSMTSTLRANNVTFTTNDNSDPYGPSTPDYKAGCIGYRSDIGGTKEGAVALVKLLGETKYYVDNSKCRVAGFKYNVIRR